MRVVASIFALLAVSACAGYEEKTAAERRADTTDTPQNCRSNADCTAPGQCCSNFDDPSQGGTCVDCRLACVESGSCAMVPPNHPNFAPCAKNEDCLRRCQGTTGWCSPPGVSSGTGDICYRDTDCTKTSCQNGSCVPGGQGHLCRSDDDCTDKRCSDSGTCILGGSGANCSQDSDCSYKMCLNVGFNIICAPGSQGTNQRCQTAADCTQQQKGTCTSVPGSDPPSFVCSMGDTPGPGAACVRDSDCVTQKICKSGSCVVSSEEGTPCNADADCTVKVCDFWGSCTVPNGGGYGGRCTDNSQCTHKVCFRNDFGQDQCVQGGNPGIDECQADADCPRIRPPPIIAQRTEPAPTRATIQKIARTLRSHLGQREAFGDLKGAVDLVFVQDLTCGMCRKAFKTKIKPFLEKQARASHVRVRFLEYPLGFYRPETKLAEAALCAGDQGRYLAFVERVYDHTGPEPDRPEQYASALGMNVAQFSRCLQGGRHAEEVRRDYELAGSFGVQGTPTIFVNGHKFVGYHDDLDVAALVKDSRSSKRGG
jgi:protein-disulfide isomerase